MSYATQIGQVGQVIPFQAHPADSETPPKAEPLDGAVPITFTVDDPTVASAQMLNNSTLQGQFTLLKAGTTTVHLNATSNGTALTEGVPIQVNERNATTFGLTFGSPVG